jgi:hypothetical protein
MALVSLAPGFSQVIPNERQHETVFNGLDTGMQGISLVVDDRILFKQTKGFLRYVTTLLLSLLASSHLDDP